LPRAVELKRYLLGDKVKGTGYLRREDTRGKILMISGRWGAGKTHFWKNEVEPELKETPYVYVSLYGKDSLALLKQEIITKAFESIGTAQRIGAKFLSVFSVASKAQVMGFGLGQGSDTLEEKFLAQMGKVTESKLTICFDDFERKSVKIDLHDLFGFITLLATELDYRVVIVLNQDFFLGRDADLFATVKEKSVNKFLLFEPTIDELFAAILKGYRQASRVKNNKETILASLRVMNVLNARIYKQVIESCEEYLAQTELKRGQCLDFHLSILVTKLVNFVKHNMLIHLDSNKQASIPALLPTVSEAGTHLIAGFRDKEEFFKEAERYIRSHPGFDGKEVLEDVIKRALKQFEEKREALWSIQQYETREVERKKNDIDLREYAAITRFVESGVFGYSRASDLIP
jgi:hypothetical protein